MKCKITLGDVMKIERDERRFDFHDIGLAIKRAREASGMTQEQLAYIVDRAPRTIMYHGSILKSPEKVCKIHRFIKQIGTYYTTTTPFVQ